MKRQVSSQFSNYIEIDNRHVSHSRMGKNNNITDSSRQSDYSGKKRRENSMGGAGKFQRKSSQFEEKGGIYLRN